MAFNAKNFKVTDWVSLNLKGRLVKIARTFNSENLVSNEYKTISNQKIGNPSLFIEYIYDTSGNILAQNEEIREWTQTQEDINTGATATEIAAGGDNVTAATKTTYATVETNVQTWLGREADGQLTKINVGTATSIKQIFHYALPDVSVGDTCLQRVNHINSSVITSYVDLIGTWTQAMQDIAAPPISDITLSALTTVEDQLVGINIGTLATAGGYVGHGTITWTLTSTTLSGDKLRIGTGADVDKLEVGPNAIGAADAGSYNAVIRGTDELGGYREETFVIVISSNDLTDIALTALTIPYGSNADVAIGTLSSTGGIGGVSFAITSAGGMTNLRIDTGGVVLEAGPSWMNTAAGSYTVRITVTDSHPLSPQTYYEDFTIVVSSTAVTDIALSAASINYGDNADTAIGTLSFTGGVSTVTPTISSNGGMTNLRLDGNVLEAGPSWMNTAAGTYSVTVLATDTRGQTYSESFTITVVSTAITDTALSAASINYGDAADTAIGTLSFTGGVGAVTPTISSAGGMTNLRLDGNVLEAGPSFMNTAVGTHSVTILATDTRSQTYSESFTITVVSTAITDIALSATTVLDNAVADVLIGNLTVTGGVGASTFEILSAGGLDNVRIDGIKFEVGSGGIIDVVASYSIQFRATDTRSQTYTETIAVSVTASYTNNNFLSFDVEGANEYLAIGNKADFDDSDDFFFRRRSDNWTISWWMRLPESTADYTAVDSGVYDRVVFKCQSSAFTNGPQLYFRAKQFKLWYGKSTTEGGLWELEDVVDWQDNVWHNYVLTWDATAALARWTSDGDSAANLESYLKLYRDGSQITVWSENNSTSSGDNGYTAHGTWFATNYGALNTTKEFRFGYPDPNAEPTNSFNKTMGIDDIAIWKSTLTTGNISTIYNSGTSTTVVGIDDTNLKRYYQFEEDLGKALDFNTYDANEYIAMGLRADWDDSDSFFFRRRADDWTISWWMKFPASTADYTVGNYNFDKRILRCQNPQGQNGMELFLKHKSIRFWYGRTGAWGGFWMLEDVVDWQDGKYHHYALTWDAGEALSRYNTDGDSADIGQFLKFYRDGSEMTAWRGDGGGTFADDGYNDVPTWFDANYEDNNTTHHFRFGYPDPNTTSTVTSDIMSINDIAVWKSTLSAANMVTIYNDGVPNDVSTLDASNLKRYYKFEAGDGTDTAGNYTATIGSAAEVINIPDNTDSAGKYTANIGSAATALEHYDNTKFLLFNGHAGASIEVSNIASGGSYEVIKETKSFTIAFWYKGGNANGEFCASGSYAGGGAQLAHIYNYKFYIQSAPGSSAFFGPTAGANAAMIDDLWHHVVVTFKGVADSGDTWHFGADAIGASTAGFSVYVDGVVQIVNTATSSTNDFENTDEFQWFNRTAAWYAKGGDYDNCAIFNVRKTGTQILAMYNEGHGTNLAIDTTCVSLLRADDMTTAAISDSGTVTNSSTATNAAQHVAVWDTNTSGTLTVTEY